MIDENYYRKFEELSYNIKNRLPLRKGKRDEVKQWFYSCLHSHGRHEVLFSKEDIQSHIWRGGGALCRSDDWCWGWYFFWIWPQHRCSWICHKPIRKSFCRFPKRCFCQQGLPTWKWKCLSTFASWFTSLIIINDKIIISYYVKLVKFHFVLIISLSRKEQILIWIILYIYMSIVNIAY